MNTLIDNELVATLIFYGDVLYVVSKEMLIFVCLGACFPSDDH